MSTGKEEGRDLEVALSYAPTARRIAPNEPAIADALPWIQHKKGTRCSCNIPMSPASSRCKSLQLNSKEDFKEKGRAEDALEELRQAK